MVRRQRDSQARQRSVEGMLLGVGVESPEDLRGSDLLEFDGCNESENIVPVVFDESNWKKTTVSYLEPAAAGSAVGYLIQSEPDLICPKGQYTGDRQVCDDGGSSLFKTCS